MTRPSFWSHLYCRRKVTPGSSRPQRTSTQASVFVSKPGNIACSLTRTASSSHSRPPSAPSTPLSPSRFEAPRSTSPSALCKSFPCIHDDDMLQSGLPCLFRDDNATAIYVDDDTRIQILDSMPDLPRADKEQCGAFIVSWLSADICKPSCLFMRGPTARRTGSGCLVGQLRYHHSTVP